MKDCCKDFCITTLSDIGQNHHKNCPKYSTEKHPYLFYWEEAVDGWVPAPQRVDGQLICTEDQLDDREIMEIRFKRIDLTDAEFDEIPED